MLMILLVSCDVENGDVSTSVSSESSTTVSAEWDDGFEEWDDGFDEWEESGSVTSAESTEDSEFPYVECNEETDLVIISVKGYGKIVVALMPEAAPETVANFKGLVSDKFYDGLIFHRVINGFMIQGGGFDKNFVQQKADTIKGEFASNGVANDLKHTRGVISMARTLIPDSATSQFFIMHEDAPHLDGQYAAFGNTVYGIEVVDKIAESATTTYYIHGMPFSDSPINIVEIESIRFAKEK